MDEWLPAIYSFIIHFRKSILVFPYLTQCSLVTLYGKIYNMPQVIACLTAPRHCLNQYRRIINEVTFIWEGMLGFHRFTGYAQDINEFENEKFKITVAPLTGNWVNSSPPNAAYMRQWTGLALVDIMVCRLFGTKPLSKAMLGYCQLDP